MRLRSIKMFERADSHL